MASIRPRAIPQCSACVRRLAWGNGGDYSGPSVTNQQQFRWKRRLPNNSATVMVRLLKDVDTYGARGAIVPVVTGKMRNGWFPAGKAEYVTHPQLRQLQRDETPMERDYLFLKEATRIAQTMSGDSMSQELSDSMEMKNASMFRSTVKIDKVSPERSAGLLDIFVPSKLEFYRQPIMEIETKLDQDVEQDKRNKRVRSSSAAASDLLAATEAIPGTAKPAAPQAIYGSVSLQDVLNAIKAALGNNEEAQRVALDVDDLSFTERPTGEELESDKLKHIGQCRVEIRPKGTDTVIRRTIEVIAQDG